MFHPWAWDSWVPQHLLAEYIYYPEAVGFGHSSNTGFFVMTKDEETLTSTVLFQEREGEPNPVDNDESIQGYKFAISEPEMPKIEGVVLSTEAMHQILGVPMMALDTEINALVISPRESKPPVMFVRIAEKLYEVASVETPAINPA